MSTSSRICSKLAWTRPRQRNPSCHTARNLGWEPPHVEASESQNRQICSSQGRDDGPIRHDGVSIGALRQRRLGVGHGCEVFYDLLGGWTAYLISTLYVEYRTRKEREELNFRNHVIQWVEILDGLLKKHWRNMGLASNYTFLLFGSVIQLIACARLHLSEALTWPSVLIEWKSVKKIQRVLSGSREKVNIGLNPLGN
ncbi:hypothetical protein JHK85_010243 [Glycine max]|nr:hypothetical protein JHK85_010243 [Glycine max]